LISSAVASVIEAEKQALAVADVFFEEGIIHLTQGKPRVVATHLSVKRGIAIDKIDGEAEFRSEEVGG